MNIENISRKDKIEVTDYIFSKCRNDLYNFIITTKTDYDTVWFHRLIISKIQDLIDGKIHGNKLAIFVPPQHGKSEISSRRAPAFILGSKPGIKIAIGCYNKELASDFSIDIKNIVNSYAYRCVFPELFEKQSNKTILDRSDEWELINGSELKAVGVGSGISGRTVDFMIIDDPIKDDIEAQSRVYRERVWNWYIKSVLTRLHNNAKVLMLLTRWHVDDLAGRILAQEKDWEVISIPAICEKQTEYDKRNIGDALYPSRHSLERILKFKQLSPATFNSLFQQRPTIEGGNKIKVNYFKIINENQIPGRINWELFVDGAYTESTKNDPTALMVCGERDGNLYIKYSTSKYQGLIEACNSIQELYRIHFCEMVNIEPKASGISMRDTLKGSINISMITGKILTLSKYDRVSLTENYVEAGKVYLIEGDWNNQFKQECADFPKGEHDDQVDNFAYAVNKFLRSKVGGYYSGN